MFDAISGRLNDVFGRLRAKGRLTEADVDAALREVRLALLEADVNVSVAKAMLERVRARAVGVEVTGSLTPGQQVVKIVHDELLTTLGEEAPLVRPPAPPLVILVAGLQGSGKTTTAAKLANHLKGKGRRPLLVAADLQRPAAIDQLETLGRRIGVPVLADRKSKPARMAKASLKYARQEGLNVVIVDTAGRLQIDEELMRELAAVEKAAEPHEVLLVVDAMTGQEAVNVAKGFGDRTTLTGLVLTKLDGDARGGAAISAREVTGKPIKFVGLGEGLDDLDVFHPGPDGIPDPRHGRRAHPHREGGADLRRSEQTAATVEKMLTASFDLDDFLDQLQQLRKMGPLQQLVSMLPGAGQMLRDVDVDERNLSRVEAIIRSMTTAERRDPKGINGSRKRRIANGSGTRPQDVNRVLKQFSEAQKMMKAVAGGKSPIPGLAAPVMGRRRKR